MYFPDCSENQFTGLAKNLYLEHNDSIIYNKMINRKFVDYLQSRSVGERAKSIYQRFKKVIRYAI